MLPDSYLDGSVRTLLPLCPNRQRFGLGIDVGGGVVVRVALAPESLRFLQLCLDDYRKSFAGDQSPISELSPSEPMSHPSYGV